MTAAKPDTPKTLPPHDPRFAGTTGYSPGKMLRLASYLGLAMGCGSIAMIAYTLLSWSMHSAVTGWTSLSTIMLAIGGTQLLDLRRFGEYLGRLDVVTESPPLGVADSTISSAPQAKYEEADASRRMAA